jgi:hypothetical protein
MTRQVPTGGRVGYSGRWTALRPSRVGILQLGYADGYPWKLSNRAEALVEGAAWPVVARCPMDMIAVDLTDTAAGLGADVVLLGRQGGEQITAWEIAEPAETIPTRSSPASDCAWRATTCRAARWVETTRAPGILMHDSFRMTALRNLLEGFFLESAASSRCSRALRVDLPPSPSTPRSG